MSPGGQQRQWPHLKTDPWGETPTLALPDGSFLAELVAIAQYLDQAFDGRQIFGITPLEQALDTQWNDRN